MLVPLECRRHRSLGQKPGQTLSSRSLGVRLTLRIQVYKQYLPWGLQYVNKTYFGLFGSPGQEPGAPKNPKVGPTVDGINRSKSSMT